MGFYEDSRERQRPVVIFGASVLGEVALQALEVCGLRPVCFGDNDREKQKKFFHGYPVCGLEEIHGKYPGAVIVIAAGRYYSEIYDQVFSKGYRQIYNDADVIDRIDFASVPFERIKGFLWRLAQLGHLSRIKNIPTDALHLERLNIVVTQRCTLSCRHCSSLMPFYENPRDCDTSLLLKSIERIMNCVDYIYHLEVLGGETLLNKDLPLIMNTLNQYENIFQIDVITNGTLLPRPGLLECLKHDSICVVVNDYGPVSRKKEELLDALNRAGVRNRQNRHWAWADLGGFEPRHRGEESLTRLFQECNFSSCTELLDGKLHRCPRSSHGTRTGMIPEYASDFIDVLDLSIGDDLLKERLRAFFQKTGFIRACDHCNGNTRDSLKLTPAEQQAQEVTVNG
ncbi:hypothetical protein SAMN04489760_12126 [Syntrophus gentianae]|uniref:4Fe-4S single cluster domain-containing protein n=1 Tax=Syntrophus gentianae TaxID=43775 RepID=A0A1H7Z9B0_9BACT|nr:hypothetical protein [Syntrophus gentianae]SEM54845.1 hypothetical protein SAMN04489760_12126 [Syntrophus gentianae]